MGCCGDEDEDEILKHLNPTTIPTASPTPDLHHLSSSTSVSGGDVISPMNSHFSALTCRDTLRIIFEKLTIRDLASASCVCRTWNSVASDRDILTRAFKAPWKLKELIGEPISVSFWRDSTLGKFAISHRIVRGDTVARLAVKYSVQVMDIKRLNNMMSEHGIYSRERLLIPISDPEILNGGVCYVEMDVYAKREVAVLYLEGTGPDLKTMSSLIRRTTSDQGMKRVIHSLRRSMQVDEGTAQYYLSISNGDPRAALSEFSEDLRWEKHAGFA